jgi:gas vesicle structural protein
MCGSTDQAKREQCVAVVERSTASFIDVLDRVLDKGIVIDGWGRVSFVGLDLITIDGWVVVASIETYLHHADALGLSARPDTSWPTHFAAADG